MLDKFYDLTSTKINKKVKLVFKDTHWRLGGLFIVVMNHELALPVVENSVLVKLFLDRIIAFVGFSFQDTPSFTVLHSLFNLNTSQE